MNKGEHGKKQDILHWNLNKVTSKAVWKCYESRKKQCYRSYVCICCMTWVWKP